MLYLIFISTTIFILIIILKKPTHNRNWSEDQKVLPSCSIKENLISIYNIRNFKYESDIKHSPSYYNKTYNLDKITSTDFIYVPFSDFPGAAHTFLSFGFENNEYLAISIEIRKKKGDKFSALKGLFNYYEIMYVVADEKDIIKLRTDIRNEKVYIFPTKVNQKDMKALFLDIMKRINKLNNKAEFYNTLFNNCAIGIVKHINSISHKKIPFNYKIMLPGYSDKLAYEQGLINSDKSLEESKELFLINEKAAKFNNSENFSQKIRNK